MKGKESIFGKGLMKSLIVAAIASPCFLVLPAQGAPPLHEDFQGDTPGGNPAGAVFVSEPAGTGADVVDGTTTPSDPFGPAGNQSLMIFDDATNTGSTSLVGYQFPSQTGSASLSIDFYVEKNPDWNDPYSGIRFVHQDADPVTTVAEIGPWLLINGWNNPHHTTFAQVQVLEFNGTGTNFVGTTLDVSYNTRHTLTLDFDLATDTYTAAVDGTQLTTGTRSVFNFYTPQSEIDDFEMYTANSARNNSRLYYDNLNVAVPEPASLTLLSLGGLALLGRRHRV
jgi:hypothetical protein